MVPLSSDHFHPYEWAKRHRKQLSTRNTHQDGLTDRQFELLIEGCEQSDSPANRPARFVCLVAGGSGFVQVKSHIFGQIGSAGMAS